MIKKGIYTILFGIIGLFQVSAQTNDTIVINSDIQLIRLSDSIFVHVTWENSQSFGRFPSNGMIIVKNGQAVMVDTPMDNEKTKRLTEYLNNSMQIEVIKLIICHFHNDCLGGLEYIQSKGIESIASVLTVEKCKEHDLPIPSTPFSETYSVNLNGEIIKCAYWGAGHTVDNITVYLPNKKILFGGCLIKTNRSVGLGNLNDAVVSDWDTTIENLMKAYTDIKIVVPGHGAFGSRKLLTHTIKLVQTQKNK